MISKLAIVLCWIGVGASLGAQEGSVIINEFMAVNETTLRDEDGDYSDWIEIHNPGTNAVNLEGWYLTDETNNLRKWGFPNVDLPGNGFLVIFASQKDRTNPAGPLHTNFKLSSEGEYLALIDPGLNIISAFAPSFPPQLADVSYGRDRTDPRVLGFFPVATPGTPNSTAGSGFAPAVVFSPAGGTFLNPFGLALSLDGPPGDAVIRYTLNGTTPINSSLIYTNSILILGTIQVRARAFRTGLLPGPVRSESYLALNTNVITFTSDLPIVVLDNFGAGAVSPIFNQLASLSIIEPLNGRTSLTNAPALVTRASISARAGFADTENRPKQSFAVRAWNELDEEKSISPLGLPEDSDWVLAAPNYYQPALIHDPFMFELSNEMGRYAPRTRFVELYLSTSGAPLSASNYHGVYVLMEKIKRGKDRVAIDKLEPEQTNAPAVTGGYLLKIDGLDPGDSGFPTPGLPNVPAQTIAYVDPTETVIESPQRDAQEQYIRGYLANFVLALSGTNFADATDGYASFIDVDSWIDHHLLNVLAFNVDALQLSAYFYKPREGKLHFGPLWDFDRALGSLDGRDTNPRVWSAANLGGTDVFNYGWWGRLFQDINFWQKWIDRYQEQRSASLNATHLNGIVDTLATNIREAQIRDQAKWGTALGSVPRGGSYEAEVILMKNWVSNRLDFIDRQFVAKPVIGSGGGPIPPGFGLTITGPPGAIIYYTLDGTDPRLPGGEISPLASAYSSSIILTNNARVVARARDVNHTNLTGPSNPPLSSPWSGPATGLFIVSTPRLVITEVMYHPAPPPPGVTNSAEDFEYIELKNIGSAPFDLAGVQLINGVSFTFPSLIISHGQYVLVVKNRAAFESRYGTGLLIAGEYLGSLDNGGERITLLGAFGEPILDFLYADEWYPITDGPGFSLVIANENAPPDAWRLKSGWRPSGVFNGSPGQADPAPPVLATVVVNEVLSYTALPQLQAIELYNPTPSPVDVGNWFLTDDFDQPRKFHIPPGTMTPAGGYLVFTEADFNPGFGSSFSFSPDGDAVYLFSADPNGILTGYVHGFEFGAAEINVSFGRYVSGTGEELFVPQTNTTLGAANAGPKHGVVLHNPPLALTELMYHPSEPPPDSPFLAHDFEFIELKNNGPDPLNLAGMRFTSGIALTLSDFILLPGQYTVVVKNKDAFRSRYGRDIPIAGDYKSGLSNDGERVKLISAFDETILNFNYKSSWQPATGGAGFSLVLRNEGIERFQYDNPASWKASSRSGGSPGRMDPPPVAVLPVLINEVLTHAESPFEDAIELFNPTASEADISGWYLTDDLDQPQKFRIPGGTSIPAGGYLALDEHTFNSEALPGSQTFSFRAEGEAVYLCSADAAGNLTGYTHGFEFGAAEANVSFGRYLTSVGEEHFVAQKVNTFFEVNAGPKVGPVVISEIMYHPPGVLFDNREDEYIELHNLTTDPAALFDPANPIHTWRLANAVEFTFPTNQIIPGRAHLLVVSFNPMTDTNRLAMFRASYGLSSDIAIIGPYAGSLNNNGASLELAKPLVPAPAFEPPPYVLVDKVTYSAFPPWPSYANGTGSSLQRKQVGEYGNDLTNWIGALPTPGCGSYAPCLTVQPQSRAVFPGPNVTFSVVAGGVGPLSYQWRFNGTTIPGATAADLSLPNVQVEQAGTYEVVVTDQNGSATSRPAMLTVLVRPVVTLQPQDHNACSGDTVTFSVSVNANPPPFGFRWRRNGGTFTNMVLYTNHCLLTLPNVRTSQAGLYSVVITNLANPVPGILSSNAVLTVTSDCDGDGLPGDWETAHGFDDRNPNDAALDSDGDGMSNWQEYIAGTNPRDAQSYLRIDTITLTGGGTGTVLQFLAVSNKTYTVQYRDVANGGAWSVLSNVAAATINRPVSVNDVLPVGSGGQRYYRLATPRIQ